jgi:hypothetical protein
MTHSREVITVFYSSPDRIIVGVDKKVGFDRKVTFDSVCKQVGSAKEVIISVIWWKDIAGGLAQNDAQEVIDDAVAGNHDIYFGFLGGMEYGLGTIHEYEEAVKAHINKGQPKQVFFGFDAQPVNPFDINLRELGKVKQFMKDIGSSKRFGKALLYFKFENEKVFSEKVFTHLCAAVDEILSRVRGGMRFR